MSGFLAQSSCEGRRPSRLKIHRYNSRPHLVSRLLSERNVARFVVAPDGFGKTSVVLEYAETIFHFEHVFWIDARNPRFLRDLDKGIFAEALLEMDSTSFLVVIEDVPRLDYYRSQILSKEIALLLDRGCEVIVTCTPGCDAFGCH